MAAGVYARGRIAPGAGDEVEELDVVAAASLRIDEGRSIDVPGLLATSLVPISRSTGAINAEKALAGTAVEATFPTGTPSTEKQSIWPPRGSSRSSDREGDIAVGGR
jgi:hypothetical protein